MWQAPPLVPINNPSPGTAKKMDLFTATRDLRSQWWIGYGLAIMLALAGLALRFAIGFQGHSPCRTDSIP
jgi:hypothetical protein